MSFVVNQYIPRPSSYVPSQFDINILMMGETGVGKSTFINAFANYIIYNTLNEAIQDEIQVLIPCIFHITDPDTYEPKKISIGQANDDEKCELTGQSSTQICHSYIFPIGNRLLRLIDVPGIGDVRGIDQDKINCDHILAYINHYEHLNGICILLKPNNERLNIGFRFCFKEILTHLHIKAKDNLMFIFTNGRSTFYRPGSTTPLIRTLIKELNDTWKVEIPFNKENTFMFDNEAFRFLVLCKNGLEFSNEETNNYSKSWKISIKEFTRLIERILKCELHAVKDSVSINAAQQLIRKLTRPIGEIARLIQENIQLAKNHKSNILNNPLSTLSKRIPQKMGKILHFDYPRTVCVNRKCTEIIIVDDQRKVDYITKCHLHCYLRDVEQECIGHSMLKDCHAINKQTGLCNECGCSWTIHMHISYEYETFITFVNIDNTNSQSVLTSIDKHIAALREEENSILEVCGKLSQFLKKNSITPYNDEILGYIRYFISEEEMKRDAGAKNEDVIQGLKNMIQQYENEQKLFNAVPNENTSSMDLKIIHNEYELEDIFGLVGKLYKLPINGSSIQQQVKELKENQWTANEKREHFVEVPFHANSSTIMQQLKNIVSQ
ncbi:unnamed protein product [Rotaria sordida]|uniref:DUF8206 domain-containing protein n=1 Tax=Rotaria sordida TaxID=392033 RepID=A0A815IPH2_9BILA|nr:unnamed protein product [Rotaria sordida]